MSNSGEKVVKIGFGMGSLGQFQHLLKLLNGRDKVLLTNVHRHIPFNLYLISDQQLALVHQELVFLV